MAITTHKQTKLGSNRLKIVMLMNRDRFILTSISIVIAEDIIYIVIVI